jgi:23S rRNA (cytosine1962-C5)-methyltransferase
MKITNDWKDYECIDAGHGEKLERFGEIILRRPDPQAMWHTNQSEWKNYHAFYKRSETGGGEWQINKKFPQSWTINYKELTFKIAPMNFKHVGIFPEQAVNWDYAIEKISKAGRQIKVLNLFAYTGGATVACAYAGAEVVHVDASKGMIEWAKENVKLSNLDERKVRFILDDCMKFVLRESRRGNKYDVIIMDPPSYGRGPNKEVWKFEDNIYQLIDACQNILSDEPLFVLINSYTTGISSVVLENILKNTIKLKNNKGRVFSGEIGLNITRNDMKLPCGIYGLYENED